MVSGAATGDALVLFGATGDLARKKIFPAVYHLAAAGQLDVPIVGVASSAWDDADLGEYASSAVHAAVSPVDPGVMKGLVGRLAMVSGDYRQPGTFQSLARRLGQAGCRRPVHYLAIPRRCSPWSWRAWPLSGCSGTLAWWWKNPLAVI